MPNHDPIARAFELARSGKYRRVEEIQREMMREGYSNVPGHFAGPTLKKQLRALIAVELKRPE